MIENMKLQAAKIFKVEENDIKVINRLLGGKSHYTYLIEVGNESYVIRLIGEGGNLFVDRREEYENLKKGAQLGLNNETVYFDIETGTRVSKFLKGQVLTEIDTLPLLENISKALKKMHNSGIKAYKPYNLINRLNDYESNNEVSDPLYYEMKDFFLKHYEINYGDDELVFCHNDLQKSNMLINEDKVYLLDWEYVADNHYLYDIASYGEYNEELLAVYLNRTPTKEEIRDMTFFSMYQWLQWHQLALYKDNAGLSETLKTDFKFLTDYFLNEAKKDYLKIRDDY